MMKSVIAAGAALLLAGTASAADVRVAVDPDADGEVIVRHVEWPPAMSSDLVGRDDQGMLSADDLVEGADAETIFGFDPDAVIHIRPSESENVRIFEIE